MIWLIIVGVLLAMVSPALGLRPSSHDRRVAALRKAAMEQGVKVQLISPPMHDGPRLMPCYCWEYPKDRPGPRFVLVRDQESGNVLEPYCPGWRWRIEPLRQLPEDADRHLQFLLGRLPTDARVVESDRGAVILWWNESLDHEAFSTCLADFVCLKEQLAGRPDQPASRLSNISKSRDPR